ncbi:hypothetical protein [uncultured Nostoc sp.]
MTSINIKFLEESVSKLVNLDIETRLIVIALLYTNNYLMQFQRSLK